MGVAKEKQVQILCLGGKTRVHQRLFDTIGMTVTHEDAEVIQAQQPLRRFVRAEIAVAGYLL